MVEIEKPPAMSLMITAVASGQQVLHVLMCEIAAWIADPAENIADA